MNSIAEPQREIAAVLVYLKIGLPIQTEKPALAIRRKDRARCAQFAPVVTDDAVADVSGLREDESGVAAKLRPCFLIGQHELAREGCVGQGIAGADA